MSSISAEHFNVESLAENSEKVALWKARLFHFVNFLTMKPYDFDYICALGTLWFTLTENYFPKTPHTAVLDPTQIKTCHQILEHARGQLNYVELIQSAKYVSNIREKLNKGECKTFGDYYGQVGILFDLLSNELEGIVFGFIPRERGEYFQQNALFGEEVNKSFPSAVEDIKEAGNCYAHGSYTACVFHLMRALEHPLRALAVNLKVPPPTKNPQKTLDLRTWGDVINAISAAINSRPNPKNRAQAELTEFYNKAADQFQFFKDAWRDVVMHTRSRPYQEGEAKDLIKSVETFMRRIAPKLKEKKRAK